MKKSFRFPSWTFPLVLLGLCVAAFGFLIPWLGFYWDDWAKILVSRLYGLQGYWAYYAEDRPLSAWTHIALTPLLGNSPLPWQIFALIMRWLSAVAVWWVVRTLWPQRQRLAIFSAAIFVVYPVFIQQAVAVTFHQQWLQYALVIFSFGAMLQSLRYPRRFWVWTGLSVLAMLVELSITEYFVGLELARFALIWIFLSQRVGSWRSRVVPALRYSLPYVVVFATYVVWRMFFIHLSGPDPYRATTLYNLIANPLTTLGTLAYSAFMDAQEILVSAWLRLIYFNPVTLLTTMSWIAFGLGLLTALGLVVYALYFRDDANDLIEEQSGRPGSPVVFGIVAVLLGMLPAWLTGRLVLEDFHANRYAIPAMMGASLFIAGLIEAVIHKRLQRIILASLLVALGVSLNIQVSNDYRFMWQDQTRFYWDLHWRAPTLQPGTALIFEDEPFPNQGLFSTSSAINLLYPQPAGRGELAYWVYTLVPRLTGADGDKLLKTNLGTQFRTLVFHGSGGQSILIENDPTRGHCAWVLSSADEHEPRLSALMRKFLSASRLELIGQSPSEDPGLPADLFGREPAHNWCYYYEKAELARQYGDWQSVAQLGDEAQQKGYTPANDGSNSPHEWLPFIDAYWRVGDYPQAKSLTVAAFEADPEYQPQLCKLWGKPISAGAPGLEERGAVLAALNCTGED